MGKDYEVIADLSSEVLEFDDTGVNFDSLSENESYLYTICTYNDETVSGYNDVSVGIVMKICLHVFK